MFQTMNTFINSPLDQFEIKTLLGFQAPFMNISNINITTFSLYSFIILLVVLSLYLLSNNNNRIIGSKWYVFHETVYDTIMNMVKNMIQGNMWGYYFPLIYTFFMFIMIANMMSLIPYSFALTSNFMFIISLSFVIWIGITLLGLYKHGLIFFSLFVPHNTPLVLVPLLVIIELLSYIARAISLGLRLSVNNCAGHLLMSILSGLLFNFMSISFITFIIGFMPLLAILAIFFLELAIGLIQSYVWSILTSSYLKDALYLH
uniref:ATP synthase subunit a n=1 Tax=Huiozyma sinensis TaxID=588727 RepID=A0A2H4ZR24_9SACH|nr:Atp6p [Kazachstania sinensis]AUG33508.1 Atp6p [Kazachstania sinensis]